MTYLISILCLILTQDCYHNMTSITFRCAPLVVNDPVFNNLFHVWHLGEASGTARVDSVGSATLTESGGSVGSSVGIHGNDALFNNANPGILSSGSNITVPSSMTVAMWIKFHTLPAAGKVSQLFFIDDGADGIFDTIFHSNGAITWQPTIDDGFQGGPSVGTLDVWHLLVLRYGSGADSGMSYDGGAFTSFIGAGTLDNGILQSAGIGLATTCEFQVDEMMMWPVRLTQANVTTLWNGGAGTFYSP